MIKENSWYKKILSIAEIYNKIINFLCVILLTAQTISILIMVFGRYIFNHVPKWSEQFALFCMIWFAMFSIALAVRDDSHVKMEVIDNIVSESTLRFFKLFGMLCNTVFGFVMVYWGMKLVILTWPTKLSAFRISTGIQYFSAVAGGFFIITNAIVFCIEMFVNYHDAHLNEKEATS